MDSDRHDTDNWIRKAYGACCFNSNNAQTPSREARDIQVPRREVPDIQAPRREASRINSQNPSIYDRLKKPNTPALLEAHITERKRELIGGSTDHNPKGPRHNNYLGLEAMRHSTQLGQKKLEKFGPSSDLLRDG
jgi:hypothetical protein